jgi:hypothetical protein
MRISAGVIVATLLAVASTASGQWIRYKESGVPRTRDGLVNLNAATPKLDGKPDLSGVWLAEPDPPKALGPFAPPEEFLGEPGFSKYFFNFFFDSPGGQPPYTPAAAAAEQARERTKPETACDLPALPQWNLIPAPMKIVQAKRQVVVLYEAGTVFRQIYTDGRPLPDDPNPSRFGYSTARWNGDTLMVETIGLNGKRLDAIGHTHSERLRLTERFKRRNYGHMMIQTTVDDPMTYVKPVTISVAFKLLPDSDVLEAFCQENEKDLIHIQRAFELDQIQAKPQP